MDLKLLKLSNRFYGGSERKIGLTDGTNFYMAKFRKKSEFGLKYNHVSEFLGSHIFDMLGFNVHETYLEEYKGEQVVICKDFNIEGSTFVPFNDVGESTIETDMDKYQYSYEDIVLLLEKNKKITNIDETVDTFFEMFIVDALIGNFDRHGHNWGFIKRENKYSLAPVFDNGSCLFPALITDEEISNIMNSGDEMDFRVYNFPTSQIKINGKKSSYFDIISSLKFEKCNEALLKIYPRIDIEKINKLIDSTKFISEIRKAFYKEIIKERYEKIIQFSYTKLKGLTNEK